MNDPQSSDPLKESADAVIAVEEPPAPPQRKPRSAKPTTKRKNKPKKQPNYHVIIWNDEEHTYEYVIELLMKIFGHSVENRLPDHPRSRPRRQGNRLHLPPRTRRAQARSDSRLRPRLADEDFPRLDPRHHRACPRVSGMGVPPMTARRPFPPAECASATDPPLSL